MKRAIPNYLDPASRLGEVLFGLIMVLTVTLTAHHGIENDTQASRQLLLAALGCNIAWGIIDGIMYVMAAITDRAEKAKLIGKVLDAPNEKSGLIIVSAEIEPRFETFTKPEFRETLCKAIYNYLRESKPPAVRVSREDVVGALACSWLVFLSCLPASVPFMIIGDARTALWWSNGLLIAMLFVVGGFWGNYAHMNPVRSGLSMVLIGLVLVGVAIALGG